MIFVKGSSIAAVWWTRQITTFTWMQDDSNLWQPPKCYMSAKGKYIYPNVRQHPRNSTSAKKNILQLIAYT